MKVAITGASGFIGGCLIRELLASGHSVHAIGRRAPGQAVEFSQWDLMREPAPAAAIDGADAVIHLAGEPVGQRWNAAVKNRIVESRAAGTRHLIEAIGSSRQRPGILLSASAIGYYGDTGERATTEAAGPGAGFLADTCVMWENEATAVQKLEVRAVLLRSGIVLGRGGGALEKMLWPFKLGVGGPLASGTQWMSWIHIDDLIGAMMFLLTHPVSGPVNMTAPNAVRNAEFTRELARVVRRPAVIPVPRFALRLLMGEAADMMLESQLILPSRLLRAGFAFRFAYLRPALEDLLR